MRSLFKLSFKCLCFHFDVLDNWMPSSILFFADCVASTRPICSGLFWVSLSFSHLRLFFCCRHLRNIFKILFTDGCDKKRCDFYATCETDDMGRAECVCPKACSKVCSLERSLDIDVNNGDGSMMVRPQFGQPDQFSFSIDLFRYLFHLGFVYFQLSAGQCRSLRHWRHYLS